MVAQLPKDREDQVFVSVKSIVVGSVYLPFSEIFDDCIGAPKIQGNRVPVICFLITHPTKGHALFDLGIRKVSSNEEYTRLLTSVAFSTVKGTHHTLII